MYAREAWRLLDANYQRVIANPGDRAARAAMQLGAHLSGAAIELSMLGAAHACANPLTARYGTIHGIAVAVMLPHVLRWNAQVVGDRYADLLGASSHPAPQASAERLALRLEQLAAAGGLPRGLQGLGVVDDGFGELAHAAAAQMTGRFNPRPFDAAAARDLYVRAYAAG
jgi:alcohol dehydrogenase